MQSQLALAALPRTWPPLQARATRVEVATRSGVPMPLAIALSLNHELSTLPFHTCHTPIPGITSTFYPKSTPSLPSPCNDTPGPTHTSARDSLDSRQDWSPPSKPFLCIRPPPGCWAEGSSRACPFLPRPQDPAQHSEPIGARYCYKGPKRGPKRTGGPQDKISLGKPAHHDSLSRPGREGCVGIEPSPALPTGFPAQREVCKSRPTSTQPSAWGGAHLVFRLLLIVHPGSASVAKDRAQEWGRAPLSWAQRHLKHRAQAQWALLGGGRRLRTVHGKAWN